MLPAWLFSNDEAALYVTLHAISAKGMNADESIEFCKDVIKDYGGIVSDSVIVETKPYYSMTRFWFRFKIPRFKYRFRPYAQKEIEDAINSGNRFIKKASII